MNYDAYSNIDELLNYPLSPWLRFDQLTPAQQAQVNAQFSASIGHQHRYIYCVTQAGNVLCRRRYG